MNGKNNIHFVREQDGEVEREFKSSLVTLFEKAHKPVRAYLVQVVYEDGSEFNVALCLMVDGGGDSYLLREITRIFKSRFSTEEHLDIIFLSPDQELKVRKISCPFYIAENYQITIPDFYLISSEGYGLTPPLACFKRKRLVGKHPDGYLLCDVRPALIGQYYGLGSESVTQLILASRHQDYSLFPISEWPSYVHVALILSKNIDDYIEEADVKLIAWGELYPNKEELTKNQE